MFESAVNVMPAEAVNRLSKLKDLGNREAARMAATEKRLRLLNDNWKDQVIDEIRGRVKEETLKKLRLYVTTKDNPYKKIINRLSQSYINDPSRKFPESTATQAEAHGQWYNNNAVSQLMSRAQLYMNATNDLLIYMRRVGTDIEPCILTGNVVIVIGSEEKPTVPEVVFIRYLENPNDTATPDNTYWVVWTPAEHFMIDKNGINRPVGDNSKMINPWGVMPFVYLHRTPPVDYFFDETSGQDLVDLSLNIGVNDTMDNYSRFYSGFKQGAVIGDFDDPASGILLDPDNIVAVHGSNVTFQVLDWQLDLDALEEDKRRQKERTSRNHGVDSGIGEANREKSGIAFAMDSADLMELREEQSKILALAEKEIFKLKLIMEAAMTGRKPTKETLSITFPKPEVYIAPETELQMQVEEIAAGLTSKVDVYMKRNQLTDRTEAIDALKRIQEENDMFTDSVIMKELNSPGPSEEKEPE